MTCTCQAGATARRRFLMRLAAAGSAALIPLPAAAVGFQRLEGAVRVDGRPASRGQALRPGSRIVTPAGGRAAFAIDGIAGELGPRSGLELESDATDGVVNILRLVTGSLMSVFRPEARERAIVTPVATAGIRGTGVYAEARGYRESYFCTCFGEIDLRSAGGRGERVAAVAHAARRIVLGADGAADRIIPASRQGHTDAQVRRAAEMVGVEAFPNR